jgi:hypothetical protein
VDKSKFTSTSGTRFAITESTGMFRVSGILAPGWLVADKWIVFMTLNPDDVDIAGTSSGEVLGTGFLRIGNSVMPVSSFINFMGSVGIYSNIDFTRGGSVDLSFTWLRAGSK